MIDLIDKLESERRLSRSEFADLVRTPAPESRRYAHDLARRTSEARFGRRIFIRGLIEFTNFCRNDCYYCGIRRGNRMAERYRLDKPTILECCRIGHELGFRTFVLQGGEDAYFTDETLCDLVACIRKEYPDCAITLSAGERSRESYQKLFDAGANRYLLRHETADPEHYARLHPASLSLANRKRCLLDLKEIGFQTGCGFMVGSPFQTAENIADDLLFIRELEPEMVGLGPFIPHKDTPFAAYPAGDVELTLFLLSLVRIMAPATLLPATTALGTMDEEGREKGILAGANVLMPNLSPPGVRGKYLLYDNKASSGAEAAEHVRELDRRMQAIGYHLAVDRGDYQPVCR